MYCFFGSVKQSAYGMRLCVPKTTTTTARPGNTKARKDGPYGCATTNNILFYIAQEDPASSSSSSTGRRDHVPLVVPPSVPPYHECVYGLRKQCWTGPPPDFPPLSPRGVHKYLGSIVSRGNTRKRRRRRRRHGFRLYAKAEMTDMTPLPGCLLRTRHDGRKGGLEGSPGPHTPLIRDHGNRKPEKRGALSVNLHSGVLPFVSPPLSLGRTVHDGCSNPGGFDRVLLLLPLHHLRRRLSASSSSSQYSVGAALLPAYEPTHGRGRTNPSSPLLALASPPPPDTACWWVDIGR